MTIPKIELHLHIEGAAPPAFIRGLAQEKGVNLTGVFNEDGSYKFEDFSQFLRVYEAACTVLTGPEEFGRLTTAVLEQSIEQGVIYTEAFLSPDFCGGGDVGAWREYMHAMQEAAAKLPEIEMRGIVTCIRHFGPDKAKAAARCAAETAGDFITGFGMGGDEMQGKQGDFAYSFHMAREAGLRLTTHAGEWGGADSVRQAVRDLEVERIGHGVQAIDDDALVDHLAEHEIVLEVCPGSNVALGVYSDWHSHPIETLRERGVLVTVSTDDPPFFHTNLGMEYDLLGHHFGWEDDTVREVNVTAAKAAFCDDATREKLLKALEPAS
ncbi:adenosine deaminase [Litoreibacter janthinus]|uniref:Adenosine deaminase n=1 Tax=Litoreibacter janthinus TaxID=670154 RepID=A0A1I6GIV5_9RHOB|nr:adenosine deaminase [Litoreibacter janthinus]SFR42153.1 adenosine deaminase [Litoreibacter janthinus]